MHTLARPESVVKGVRARDRSPRLDRGTLLVSEGVSVNLYGTAREAVMWISRPPSDDDYRDDVAAAPSDAEDNRARAVRRAKKVVRLFVKGNKLGTIITLTYREQHDERARVYRDMAAFERRFNVLYPERAWLWVIERHKSGMFHVHFVTSGSYSNERRARLIAGLWGHGYVDVGQSGAPERAARYAAKYLAKDMADAGAGQHSYETRQGYRVEPLELTFETVEDAVHALLSFFGGGPSYTWASDTLPAFLGPPTWAMFFDSPGDTGPRFSS